MRTHRRAVCGLALAALVLAGCGGSGSGGTSGGGGSSGATDVTITFTGPAPTAVAARIGAGAFQGQTINSGKLTLSVPEGTSAFAVALLCPPETQTVGTFSYTSNFQLVVEASMADGTSFTVPCPSAPTMPQTGTLTGSVDASAIPGVNALGVVAASGGSSQQYLDSGAASDFSFQMPAGSDRVAVGGYVKTASNASGADTVYTLASVRGFDGVAVPGAVNGGSTIVLGAADAVTMQPISYQNVPGNYGAPSTFAYYLWSGGGGVWLSNGAVNQYPVMPAAATKAGDFYSFSSRAYNLGTAGEMMGVETNSSTGGPQTAAFPAPWTYSGPAPAALPTFDMSYAGFSGKTGVGNAAGISWLTGTLGSNSNSYQVIASANAMSGSTALAMPDLSAVPGFLASPPSGTTAAWFADILQSSNGFQQPANGTSSSQLVGNAGTFRVP